jgi:hypothetical protein
MHVSRQRVKIFGFIAKEAREILAPRGAVRDQGDRFAVFPASCENGCSKCAESALRGPLMIVRRSER